MLLLKHSLLLPFISSEAATQLVRWVYYLQSQEVSLCGTLLTSPLRKHRPQNALLCSKTLTNGWWSYASLMCWQTAAEGCLLHEWWLCCFSCWLSSFWGVLWGWLVYFEVRFYIGTAWSVVRKHLQKWLKTKTRVVMQAHVGVCILLSTSNEHGCRWGTKIARKWLLGTICSCPLATQLEMKLYLMLVPNENLSKSRNVRID